MTGESECYSTSTYDPVILAIDRRVGVSERSPDVQSLHDLQIRLGTTSRHTASVARLRCSCPRPLECARLSLTSRARCRRELRPIPRLREDCSVARRSGHPGHQDKGVQTLLTRTPPKQQAAESDVRSRGPTGLPTQPTQAAAGSSHRRRLFQMMELFRAPLADPALNNLHQGRSANATFWSIYSCAR